MKNKLNKVKEFQLAFNSPVNETPQLLSLDRARLRFKLMREENEEYLEAHENGDLIEVADALGDKLYILLGTILENGMQHKIDEVFEEIHMSNMSKLGEDGKPIINGENQTDTTRPLGKVLKGPNYFKPDIQSILQIDDIDKIAVLGEN